MYSLAKTFKNYQNTVLKLLKVAKTSETRRVMKNDGAKNRAA